MSLTIDKSKVAKLVKANPPQYIVTTSNVVAEPPPVKPPSSRVYGTSYITSAVGVDIRQHIADLRRKVVDSGMQLKTPAELDREIDEMRGRNGE